MNEILQRVLQPLTVEHNLSTESAYYGVLCADCNFRCCNLFQQHGLEMTLSIGTYTILSGIYVCCVSVQRTNLEIMSLLTSNTPSGITTYIESSAMPTPRQPMPNSHRAMFTEDSMFLDIFHVSWATSWSPTFSIKCRLACLAISRSGLSTSWRRTNGSTSTMQYGYPCLLTMTSHQKTKSFEEVSRWNGKELQEMREYLLGVVTQTLWGGSTAQRPIFHHTIECTLGLLEFYMYASYKSHNYATLSYMEDVLRRFHTIKDVFLLRRAGKKAKGKANALSRELVNKRTVDEETNAEPWTLSKMRREMIAWRDSISHRIDVSKELDADFNFPKIHLMSHWVEQIRRYRALQQYSAKRHEQALKTNLKDSWNASNHNLNYLLQVITWQRPILFIAIRELNHQALAHRWGNSAATCKVLPSGAYLAATLSSKSYVKPKFITP